MTDQQRSEIATQVRDVIDQWLATDDEVQLELVIQAVLGSWEYPGGKDADKWLTGGALAVRSIARSVVRAYESRQEPEQADLFPGYDKLHRAYVVPQGQRKGRVVLVEKLTIAEAMAIMAELYRNRTGLDVHINELQRFIDEVLIPRGNGN
jgi:hypothetical protein